MCCFLLDEPQGQGGRDRTHRVLAKMGGVFDRCKTSTVIGKITTHLSVNFLLIIACL
jgi:hypothetical protein